MFLDSMAMSISEGVMVLCRAYAMHGKLCTTAFCTAGLSNRAGTGWLPSKPHHCCASVALFLQTGPMQQQVGLRISMSFAPMHCAEVKFSICAPGMCACIAIAQNAGCMHRDSMEGGRRSQHGAHSPQPLPGHSGGH